MIMTLARDLVAKLMPDVRHNTPPALLLLILYILAKPMDMGLDMWRLYQMATAIYKAAKSAKEAEQVLALF